jgi:hypothetical protein
MARLMDDVMRAMTQVYIDNEITIERVKPLYYRLRSNSTELSLRVRTVTDENGLEIFSFTPIKEMWWDVKLFLKKKLNIGICSVQGSEIPIAVEGINMQRLFYANAHILTRKGRNISRGTDFDIENVNHLAVLLTMVRYYDQSD